ncbi:MAG: adenylylsulfate kinase [Paenibacillus sp.]|jgi:adenylylsulfate kinase|nr:adenylylsulfate kinase [Paenibacillus sp.]
MEAKHGAVLWFTGLSGSGKSTTAAELVKQWKTAGIQVEMLDGDELRETVCKGLGFSREDRLENIRRITYVAKLLSRNGVNVVVSAITPYREMRQYAREQLPGFVEIFVDCSLAECERRDVKGLYAKARRNEIAAFTGISDPYERPENPEIVIDTVQTIVEDNAKAITSWLVAKGRITAKEGAVR